MTIEQGRPTGPARIERDRPTGTARYVPPSGGVRPSGESAGAAFIEGRPGQKYSAEILRTDNPNIMRVRLHFADFSGGLNAPDDYFEDVADGLKTSTLQHDFPGYLTLPQLQVVAATPDLAASGGGWSPIFHTTLNQILGIINQGDQGEVVLVRETDDDPIDAAIVDTQYQPGAGNTTSGMWGPFTIGLTPVVIVGRGAGDAPQGLSNFNIASPTVAFTMHTDLDALTGVIETEIPDPHFLFVSGGTALYGLPFDAAGTDVPDLINSALGNEIVSAIGLIKMAGGESKAYWLAEPYVYSALGPTGCYIMEMSQDGLDFSRLPFPLANIFQPSKFRNGIVAHDGERIIWSNVRDTRDLLPLTNRPANADLKQTIFGLWVVNDWDLYALIVRSRSTGSSAGSTTARVERYDWDRHKWYAVSEDKTLSIAAGARPSGYVGANSLPWSPTSGMLHWYIEDAGSSAHSWYRMQTFPPGVNPYTKRKTAGASSGTGYTFAASGVAETPSMTIRELEGWPLCLRRIIGPPQGNIDACGTGGTPGSIEIAVARRDGTFGAVGTSDANWAAKFPAGALAGRRPAQDFHSSQWVYDVGVRITMTQQSGGTDPTRFTGNALPFILEFDARRPKPLPPIEFGDESA